MDRVVTSLMVLDGSGQVEEQAGGYSDWEARGGKLAALTEHEEREATTGSVEEAASALETNSAAAPAPATKKRKLSYKEQRELDQIPELMETLEKRQQALEEKISAPYFYQGDHREVQAVLDELTQVQEELEATLERWAELED